MNKSVPIISLLFLCCLIQLVFCQNTEKLEPSKSPIICSDCGFPIKGIPIFLPRPEYPKAALAVNASGTVGVSVKIDEQGNVIEANAVSGHSLLRAAAIKAALQAKFKPVILSGKAMQVSGFISYNFTPKDSVQVEVTEQNEPPKIISIGVLNEKAKILQLPKFPRVEARVSGSVTVQVKINLQTGEVVSATAISGHPLLRRSAELTAQQTKFEPVLNEFPTIYVTGTLVYKIEDFTGKVVENKQAKILLPIISGGIVNGNAIKLEKPVYSEEARNACANGKVEVAVLIYAGTGKVISAKAVSGNKLLWQSAEEAVMKSKFAPSNITGNKDIYVKAKIIYNFDSFAKCN